MADFLFLYSTTDGHTLKICHTLRDALARDGHAVTILPIDTAPCPALETFDRVVIGASIRYGHHRHGVSAFITEHLDTLRRGRAAFFSVNLTARKPNRCQPENNPYLLRFLRAKGWQPETLAVFAGKLDYPRYRPLDRLMIRLIMWMTHGPTNPKTVCEFTDWSQVDAFARQLMATLPPKTDDAEAQSHS
jgi:menaquinone-dependent protoporphyrinogen oxidase